MIPLLVVSSMVATIGTGRWMFGRWFNHVGLYGIVLGVSLLVFHSGLIYYYPLEGGTWLVIIAGWLSFVCGSGAVIAARFASGTGSIQSLGTAGSPGDSAILLRMLWVVNVLTSIDAVYELWNVGRLLGGMSNILVLGNLLYNVRIHAGIPGAIPYIGTLTLPGAMLAGYYTSSQGRLRPVAIVSLLAAIVNAVASMVRASLVLVAILFVTGYLFGNRNAIRSKIADGRSSFRRYLSMALAVLLLVVGMEVIRGNRGMTEGFVGQTSSLKHLGVKAGSFLTPSIIMYLSVHHGVLNQYLKKETENLPVGRYSLAPFGRFMSKLGFDTYIDQFQPFYRVPVVANTGTYLRELDSDYGHVGVVFGPFLLGLFSSLFLVRWFEHGRILDLMVLGHLYVGVGLSLFAVVTGMGVWWGSLLFSILIALFYKQLLGRAWSPRTTDDEGIARVGGRLSFR
jgi:oligosaccharide repeat unit polymerase